MKRTVLEEWVLCRICLCVPKAVPHPIFNNNARRDLCHMISECGGVPIKKDDHYPDKICSKCLKNLKIAHKFRTTCQDSHKHLSKCISSVGESDKEHTDKLVYADSNDKLELKVDPLDVKQSLTFSDGEETMDDSNNIVFSDSLESETPILETEHLDYLERGLKKNNENYSPDKRIPRKCVKRNKLPKMSKASKKPQQQERTSFMCDACGNVYRSKGRLTDHYKVHAPIKRFECEICGNRFGQAQQLSRHMNSHTGDRPFKCNYCTAAFADRSTRIKHHRIHTKERPYVCDTCNKTFPYAYVLRIHKMVHTGEKPHVCDNCGKGFSQSHSLRIHARTHEKEFKTPGASF